jgi:hypothetical protein
VMQQGGSLGINLEPLQVAGVKRCGKGENL